MGIIFSTDNKGIKVWRSDKGKYPSYAIQIGIKEGDTWINEYQKIKFKGSPDIPNGTLVHIMYGFETLETWIKDGVEHSRIVLVATNYKYEGMKEDTETSYLQMPEMPDSFSAAQDEIPF